MDILNPIKPYLGMIKIAIGAVLVLALAALVWSWDSRGDEIDALTEWQTAVVTTVTEATVEPGKDGKRKRLAPSEIGHAINVLKSNLDRARIALERIDGEAKAAEAQSQARDNALRSSLAAAEQRYRSALDRIKGLEARRPAASPGEAATMIEEDSKAAWQGWSQK